MCAAGCREHRLPTGLLAVRDPRLAACWAGRDSGCGGGREGRFDSWVCLGLDVGIDLLVRLDLEECIYLERWFDLEGIFCKKGQLVCR